MRPHFYDFYPAKYYEGKLSFVYQLLKDTYQYIKNGTDQSHQDPIGFKQENILLKAGYVV